MPNIREAVRAIIDSDATTDYNRRKAAALAQARELRFAWAEGRDSLYKFKSLDGDGCAHVQDIIENSRLYFSRPDQFNDPLDCSPIFRLAGDINDPAFIEELQVDLEKMIAEQGLLPEQEEAARAEYGANLPEMADAVTRNVRAEIRRTTRMFCLSSSFDHPLLWSHYASSHTGVCLHFRVESGTLIGAARGVTYGQSRQPIWMPLHCNGDDSETARLMSLVKADFWSYESEYRIIGHTVADWGYPFNGQYVSFEPDVLIGITLGMCIRPSDRIMVISWATSRNPPLSVYEAYEHPTEFGIMVRQIA